MLFIDLFYFFLILLIIPLSPKYIFKKEYRTLLKKRLFPENLESSTKKNLWIHAVSVGEVKSLKTLIDKINKLKDFDIILSVTTPSGYKIAKNDYNSIKVIMAPIDFSFTIKKFIKNIKPDIFILNELELWPNWISIINKKKIPILLINGRISTNAMIKYKKFKFILIYFLRKINIFLVQAEIYKNRFIELGVNSKKIKICGNIKADEAINSKTNMLLESEILKYLKIKNISNKIITCASTHISDEKIIIPLISSLYNKHSFIIVPRHPERVSGICEEMELAKIKYEVWSKCEEIDLQNKVLIFDKIGYLFNIQSISDLIIMGGTFDKKIGGHNLFEPAVLEKSIIGGPNYNNFPDIGEELVKSNIYKIVNNAYEMHDEINANFCNIEKDNKKSMQIVSNRQGSIECIIKEIQKIKC